MSSIFQLLGAEAQDIIDWAQQEARRTKDSGESSQDFGKATYQLLGREAAIRLVQQNHRRGRLTTKNEVRLRTGLKIEMPVLYREAGVRHPQEARNLRHNLFHESFVALITKLFPAVSTSVPSTGQGSLSPDLLVTNIDPDWSFVVEYKGYRSITLLSESEILKGMRYQAEYGTAWLVTSSTKSVRGVYGRTLKSEEVVKQGLNRLRNITKRRAYTEEQRENRGIARKGITHLEKQKDLKIRCKLISAEELLESCRTGAPMKGLSITTGMEFIDMLTEEGFDQEAEHVLKIMKMPARSLHSDTVTSVRLIE
ncbi:MAG: hypothetical protein JSW61_11200 [Candidatus Thorarchaeota archaeon]|nr:MAG: hypothetical protein JSW61_11200 [Candidatus Thorarchaeota archaeon]